MTDNGSMIFNPPPGWPKPPTGWRPPASWTPDPSWPPAPSGWALWIDPNEGREAEAPAAAAPTTVNTPQTPDTVTDAGTSARIQELERENAALRQKLAIGHTDDLVELDDARVLQSVGIYRFHHPLETAAAYQLRLQAIEARIASLVRDDRAI